MKKNIVNISIIIVTVSVFIILSVLFNLESLAKDIYHYDKNVIKVENINYHKLFNDDFSYININTENYDNIAFLNKNNYFKDNIKVFGIIEDKLIYIDPFQDYHNEEEQYVFGGLYVNELYYNEFLNSFDFEVYFKEVSGNRENKKFNFDENESKIIRNIVLGNNLEDRIYDGIKHDLSEFPYELKLINKNNEDIYIKIRIYRTKNNDFVIKFRDNIYYANELSQNEDIIKNAAYYTYRGDDYGYLYNKIESDEDLIKFAFHDFILQEISNELYKEYVKDVFYIVNKENFSVKDKILFLKQILYSKYKPTLREDFALRIERIKNLDIINDNRKTYRINHDFLFRLFNYPADLYSLAFYEDDLLYNIPERYKTVYENFINIIMNDSEIEYTKKNDMIVEIQNALVVIDEVQLQQMREKYGEIKVIEESNERIKYSPGYYGFLYDKINNIEDLEEFALHEEVLSNIFSEYFKNKYVEKIKGILENGEKGFEDKIREVMIEQFNFTLIPIEKQTHYREKYRDNYFNESYILKIKSIMGE